MARPDLALVDETVGAAARSGLPVSCRIDGRDDVGVAAARVAFRVVQESLTNALRHAPGRRSRCVPAGLEVRVENAPPPVGPRLDLVGTGRGLAGLRERVLSRGGSFAAGPTPDGGWRVEARIVDGP